MNDATGNKYNKPKIVKNHFEPIDLKALYEKVKQKKKELEKK